MLASKLVPITNDMEPLEILRACDGYYECPKDSDGNRLGPLVGYAGKYFEGDIPLQYVGDVYANFAAIEAWPHALRRVALDIQYLLGSALPGIGTFCGAPIGGYSLADALGLVCDKRVIKAEKRIIELPTANSREKSKLVFGRHEVVPNERLVIVEDVCNNFSTTRELIRLISDLGGIVVAIVCFLNRSPNINSEFDGIPVISLVRKIISQYQHTEEEVARDIAIGNVVWKPKNEWPRLMEVMRKNA